jgi:hypothetical protein
MKSWASALRAASPPVWLHVRLAVGDVVAHRVVEEDGLLRHLGNLAAQRAERQVAQVVAVDENAARSHVEEARNQVDQRGLARAAGAHQRQHFAGAHLQIDVVQNLVLALFGRVGKAHIFKRTELLKALQRNARGRSFTSSLASKKPKIEGEAPMACWKLL